MAKVRVVTEDRTEIAAMPSGFSGSGTVHAYLGDERFPLQLHRHDVGPGDSLEIGPLPADCLVYVWTGDVAVGQQALPAGSTVIVERGASTTIDGGGETAQLLAFTSLKELHDPSAGGHVHLLPAEKAPHTDDLGSGIGGTMFADSQCPTCDVWLHGNTWSPDKSIEMMGTGIHSHTEDEIIFVIGGSMRLGNRLVGPGTALAIAADTLYSFTVGPDGLDFVNFRAEMPADVRFVDGPSMSETGFWKEILPRPEYLEPAA